MKCKICGKKTDWDTSYGKEKFIVCPSCHRRIANVIKISTNYEYSDVTATYVIIEMGLIKEGKEK